VRVLNEVCLLLGLGERERRKEGERYRLGSELEEGDRLN